MKYLKFSFFLILFCFCNVVFAENVADVYQVEIIFFENTDARRFESEDWPNVVGQLDTKKAIHLSKLRRDVPDNLDILNTLESIDQGAETVSLVEKNDMLLNSEVNLLKKSRDQRIIAQVAWLQPLAANVRSTPVFIQAGKDNNEIQALVSIKPVKNVLELNMDLIYSSGTNAREFRITRDVKLKKKEQFYLDHPVIGAIVIVSPQS